MRATLILSGKPRDVHAIVGLALEANALEAFTTESTEHSEQPRKPGASRPRSDTPPFAKGDRVSKRWQTSKSPIPRFSTGKVTNVKSQRGGWSVLVSWDDPALDPGWIMASGLLPFVTGT